MLNDGRGLYLRVDPSGHKYWILRYHENERECQLLLGVYPDVSLSEARKKRDELHVARARGELISIRPDKSPVNFRKAAEQWLRIRMKDKAASYLEAIRQHLDKYILPTIGNLKLSEIKTPVVLSLCRKIENKEFSETPRKVRGFIGQVFRFAIASGWCEHDPTIALSGALAPHREKHYATLVEPSEIAVLMRSIKAYPFDLMRLAMLFSIYTAARPGEIRHAEWSEIKGLEIEAVKNPVWDITAEKMKMKRRHIVPHGFRAMFSTIANEHEFNRDVIKRQLAHVPDNAIRGAYNHAEYMPQRIKLMQWWADWLDELV